MLLGTYFVLKTLLDIEEIMVEKMTSDIVSALGNIWFRESTTLIFEIHKIIEIFDGREVHDA